MMARLVALIDSIRPTVRRVCRTVVRGLKRSGKDKHSRIGKIATRHAVFYQALEKLKDLPLNLISGGLANSDLEKNFHSAGINDARRPISLLGGRIGFREPGHERIRSKSNYSATQ